MDLFINIISAFEFFIEFYFFNKLINRKAEIYNYLSFVIINSIVIKLTSINILQFVIHIFLFVVYGFFVFKMRNKNIILYALITVEVMQICYGITNSFTIILLHIFYINNLKIIGFYFMIIGSITALTMSCVCYHIICKYSTYFEVEKSKYIITILIPILMVFILSEYINNTVYSNTIKVEGNENIMSINYIQILIIQIFSLFSLFCIVYTYKKLINSFITNTKLHMLEQETNFQNQYVKQAQHYYKKTKSFRHDIKNHLSVINGLLEKNNIEDAKRYLKSIESLNNELSFLYHTNNPIIDILIENKLGFAENNGIKIYCSLEIPYHCSIADTDFCIILSNALDNAINACQKTAEDLEKYIKVKGHIQGNLFLIEIINSYYGKLHYESGIGLYNIKTVAEKYNGTMDIDIKYGSFCLSVLLIIPQQQ